MFLNIFSNNEQNDTYSEILVSEDDTQTLEAFAGDTHIIMAAQELNNLKDMIN